MIESRADRYEPLPEEDARRWAKFAKGDKAIFPHLLGFVVEETRVDYCRMRLPFRTELLQGAGLMHGGAIASLLDSVLVPAVGSVLERSQQLSTVDLHVQFIGAITDEDAIAEGWITRRGRRVVFCESEAFGATSGRLVAKSVATYNVTPPKS